MFWMNSVVFQLLITREDKNDEFVRKIDGCVSVCVVLDRIHECVLPILSAVPIRDVPSRCLQQQ